VCTDNLSPDVAVMKSAKNGVPFDASDSLNLAISQLEQRLSRVVYQVDLG
jgi:hypothetical protein